MYLTSFWPAGDLETLLPLVVVPGAEASVGTLNLSKIQPGRIRSSVPAAYCPEGGKAKVWFEVDGIYDNSLRAESAVPCGSAFTIHKLAPAQYKIQIMTADSAVPFGDRPGHGQCRVLLHASVSGRHKAGATRTIRGSRSPDFGSFRSRSEFSIRAGIRADHHCRLRLRQRLGSEVGLSSFAAGEPRQRYRRRVRCHAGHAETIHRSVESKICKQRERRFLRPESSAPSAFDQHAVTMCAHRLSDGRHEYHAFGRALTQRQDHALEADRATLA